VTRDSALFLLIGLLAGFLGGYMAHEEMSEIQPQRLVHGTGPAAAAMPPAAAATAGTPGAPAGAPMAQIQELRKRVEENPNDAEAVVTLANMNFDIQNWARAQELYERALKLVPPDPDLLTDLGITLRAQGSFDAALERFREAQRIAPNHWQARFNEIVVLAIDRNDLAAAEGLLGELEKSAPGNADVARLAEEVRRRKQGQ
jgi:tetratricopeptide (TPR) repeat protein